MNPTRTCTLAILLFAWTSVFAAEPYIPKTGSPERKAIADALRIPVKAELKKEVIFKISRLKVLDGWAFLAGVPLKPDGSEMDYRGTVHMEAINEGDGQWVTVRYIIGATDVPYVDWPQEFGAPGVIFE